MKRLISLALLGLLASPAYAASELRATDAPGKTVYFEIVAPAGTVWNGTTLAAYSDGNWATYAVLATEQGTSPVYLASMPTGITAAGQYGVYAYEEASGGTISLTNDSLIAQGTINWDGAKEATVLTLPAALMAYPLGNGMSFGQLHVALQGFLTGAVTNALSGNVLTTTYKLGGATVFSNATTYQAGVTPPVQGRASTLGTIPQP